MVFMIMNTITIVGFSIYVSLHQYHDYKQSSINLSSIAPGLEIQDHILYTKLLPVQLISIP